MKNRTFFLPLIFSAISLSAMNTPKDETGEISEAYRNPLTLTLFTNRWLIQEKKVKPNPEIIDFKQCMLQHPLLGTKWIAEKGYIDALVFAYNSSSSPEKAILSNRNGHFETLPSEEMKDLLYANLMDSFVYCKKNASRDIKS